MKKNINTLQLFAFLLLSFFVVSCGTEGEESIAWQPANSLAILGGASKVEAGTSGTYRVEGYTTLKTYTWTVTGPATITGESTGETISLRFGAGEAGAEAAVVLTVTNSDGISGTFPIAVGSSKPSITAIAGSKVSYEIGTPLKEGGVDTLVVLFSKPLSTPPAFASVAVTNVGSGTLGEVKKIAAADTAKLKGTAAQKTSLIARGYMVQYTAGAGNGVAKIAVSGATATPEHGGLVMTADTIAISTIDNTPPTAVITYSASHVKEADSVMITATFSEAMAATPVMVSINGVTPVKMKATSESDVWEYWYKPTGGTNGTVSVELSDGTDLAGNEITAVSSGSVLTVDNTSPVISSTSAADAGSFARLSATSSETGTIYFVVLKKDATAPATAAAVATNAAAVASGNAPAGAGIPVELIATLGAGSYDVYYASKDTAGNWSAVSSKVSLTMN